jgi:hypothetical protein
MRHARATSLLIFSNWNASQPTCRAEEGWRSRRLTMVTPSFGPPVGRLSFHAFENVDHAQCHALLSAFMIRSLKMAILLSAVNGNGLTRVLVAP